MSIAKLFVKVFGEDIFKTLSSNYDEGSPSKRSTTSCDGLTLPEYVGNHLIQSQIFSLLEICHNF